jgi:LuxR family maltose regulon positive regulatory protein
MDDAIIASRPLRGLVESVDDGYAATSYLYALAGMSMLAARYDEALDAARQALRIGEASGLAFAIPHAKTLEAGAQMGLRNYGGAARILGEVERKARASEDSYAEANARVFTARLWLMRGNSRAALDLLSSRPTPNHPLGLRAEYQALTALGLACERDVGGAIHAMSEIRSRRSEARTLTLVAKTIIQLNEEAVGDAASECLATANETGNLDSLVLGYRAEPQLLSAFASLGDSHGMLAELLMKSSDSALASRVGLAATPPTPDASLLSPREQEVLRLLCDGLANEDIAKTLFISLSTVKVHLRHIYEKLDVRTRTQAIIRARELEVNQARQRLDSG